MNQNKEIGIIITYEDFLKISDEMKQEMLNSQQFEWFVYIKKDKYEQLSEEKKQELAGFKLTEKEPLRVKIPEMKRIFENIKISEMPDFRLVEKEIKTKHKKQSKPYVPMKIGTICTKKKGGR